MHCLFCWLSCPRVAPVHADGQLTRQPMTAQGIQLLAASKLAPHEHYHLDLLHQLQRQGTAAQGAVLCIRSTCYLLAITAPAAIVDWRLKWTSKHSLCSLVANQFWGPTFIQVGLTRSIACVIGWPTQPAPAVPDCQVGTLGVAQWVGHPLGTHLASTSASPCTSQNVGGMSATGVPCLTCQHSCCLIVE